MKRCLKAAVALVFFGMLSGNAMATESRPLVANQSSQDPRIIKIEEEQNVPGRDLRSRRGYRAGLINENEKLHVLYFLFDNRHMQFYQNEEHMAPILMVDLSSNPQVTVDSVIFEDVNGDGYNDLKIPFPGDKWIVWLWVPENRCFSDPVKD